MKNEIIYSKYRAEGAGRWEEMTYSLPSPEAIEKESKAAKEELSKLMTTKNAREKELKNITAKLDKLEVEIDVLKVKRNEVIGELGAESGEAIALNRRYKDMLREVDVLQEEREITEKYLRKQLRDEILTAEAYLKDFDIKRKQNELVELARQYNEIAPQLADVLKKYLAAMFTIPQDRQQDVTAVVGTSDGQIAEMSFRVLMPIIPKIFIKCNNGMSIRDFQKTLFTENGLPIKSAFQFFGYSEAAKEYQKSTGEPEKKRFF